MPDGKLFLGAGGKAHLCSNGKFDIGEACCGKPCAYCSGSTPKSIIAVVSGVTECGCVRVNDGHYNYCAEEYGIGIECEKIIESLSTDPNGTYILEQSELNPCLYNADIGTWTWQAGGYNVSPWTSPYSCAGKCGSTCYEIPNGTLEESTVYVMLVFISAIKWWFGIYLDPGDWEPFWCEHSIISGSCNGGTEANYHTCSSTANNLWGGGSVTITPNY